MASVEPPLGEVLERTRRYGLAAERDPKTRRLLKGLNRDCPAADWLRALLQLQLRLCVRALEQGNSSIPDQVARDLASAIHTLARNARGLIAMGDIVRAFQRYDGNLPDDVKGGLTRALEPTTAVRVSGLINRQAEPPMAVYACEYPSRVALEAASLFSTGDALGGHVLPVRHTRILGGRVNRGPLRPCVYCIGVRDIDPCPPECKVRDLCGSHQQVEYFLDWYSASLYDAINMKKLHAAERRRMPATETIDAIASVLPSAIHLASFEPAIEFHSGPVRGKWRSPSAPKQTESEKEIFALCAAIRKIRPDLHRADVLWVIETVLEWYTQHETPMGVLGVIRSGVRANESKLQRTIDEPSPPNAPDGWVRSIDAAYRQIVADDNLRARYERMNQLILSDQRRASRTMIIESVPFVHPPDEPLKWFFGEPVS
jgi:hypothetical protein